MLLSQLTTDLVFGEVLVAAEVGPAPPHLELLGGHELLAAHLREVSARHAQEVLRQLESLNDGNLLNYSV